MNSNKKYKNKSGGILLNDPNIHKYTTINGSFYNEEDLKKLNIEEFLNLLFIESSHQKTLNLVRITTNTVLKEQNNEDNNNNNNNTNNV